RAPGAPGPRRRLHADEGAAPGIGAGAVPRLPGGIRSLPTLAAVAVLPRVRTEHGAAAAAAVDAPPGRRPGPGGPDACRAPALAAGGAGVGALPRIGRRVRGLLLHPGA